MVHRPVSVNWHGAREHQLQTHEESQSRTQWIKLPAEMRKSHLLQRSKEEEQFLRAIEWALGRIRDGSFGQCLSCGIEIAGGRLEVVPWTPYCIQCQEDFEAVEPASA